MIFQVYLSFVFLYLQYSCQAQRATVSLHFYSDMLGNIGHMIVELLDCLWHCLCCPMIRAMPYFMIGPHIY
jgi:Co/Zn/Cd efflux system component